MKSFLFSLVLLAGVAVTPSAQAFDSVVDENLVMDEATAEELAFGEELAPWDRRPGRPGYPGRPGRPSRPGHGGVNYVDCDSWDYRYASCYIGHGARDVRLVQQRSGGRGRCVYGRSWGWSYNQIWVSDGCRATFEVRY